MVGGLAWRRYHQVPGRTRPVVRARAGAGLGRSLAGQTNRVAWPGASEALGRATTGDVCPKESVMSNRSLTESGRDRAAMARGAGFGRFSFVSVLAGVLVAFGGLAVLLSAAYGINQSTGVAGTIDSGDLARLDVGSATVIVATTLVAYLFGGYVAGRMARRAGLVNGFGVFVLALLLLVALGALVTVRDGSAQVAASLRDAGIPTTVDGWSQISSWAGMGSLLAMLFGAVLGGKLGERWHTKLTRRAAATIAARDEAAAREEAPVVAEPTRELRARRGDRVVPPSRDGDRVARRDARPSGVATAERPADEERR
jgi:outer membrane lipoprotein SlyB